MNRRIFILSILFTALISSVSVAESPHDILIIANVAIQANAVSMQELRDIFLKERTYWSKGGRAIPVHYREGSDLRNAFRTIVLGFQPNEEKTYWQERFIKTGTEAPPSFSNTQKAVFKLRGSVSYIFRKDYREGVSKILLVVPYK